MILQSVSPGFRRHNVGCCHGGKEGQEFALMPVEETNQPNHRPHQPLGDARDLRRSVESLEGEIGHFVPRHGLRSAHIDFFHGAFRGIDTRDRQIGTTQGQRGSFLQGRTGAIGAAPIEPVTGQRAEDRI